MSTEYFGAISVASIENALNRMLSEFLNVDVDSADFSGFFVARFGFSNRDTEQYPVTFQVKLKSSGDFKEFSLPPSEIVACLNAFFSSLDGAEDTRFRMARINYEYPQYEGDAEISMYCLLENTSDVAVKRNSTTLTDSSVMMAW